MARLTVKGLKAQGRHFNRSKIEQRWDARYGESTVAVFGKRFTCLCPADESRTLKDVVPRFPDGS